MLKWMCHILFAALILEDGRKAMFFFLVIVALCTVFFCLVPREPDMSPIQRQLGDDLVRQAVDQFPWNREIGKVEMITTCAEWPNYFSKAVRERVLNYKSDGSRKFDILQDGIVDRFSRMLGLRIGEKSLSDAEIARRLKNTSADALLVLKESGYEESGNEASARFVCTFYKKSGEPPLTVSVHANYEKGKSAGLLATLRLRGMSCATRIVLGFVVIFFFPFFASPITLAIVSRHNARSNAFMVMSYSFVLMLAVGVFFPFPRTVLGALIFCTMCVAIVWWLLFTSELIASPGFKKRMQRT